MALRTLLLLWLTVLPSCGTVPAPAKTPAAAETGQGRAHARQALAFAGELGAGRLESAHKQFDKRMQKLVPVSALGEQWGELVDDLGLFREVSLVQERDGAEGSRIVVVQCDFERGAIRLRVTLDAALQVSGLRPAPRFTRAELEAEARSFLQLLVAGSWADARARFDEEMSKMSAGELEQIFGELQVEVGELERVTRVEVQRLKRVAVVDLTCAWSRKNAVVRVALDGKRRVAGLFFKPAWNPPDYADQRRFEEHEVTVGGGTRWPLPGTLTLPRSKGPCPAAVLVHGSGPNDRDETSGPNKIFKDLAWGLASRGVAVLRYDKRTHHYRGRLSDDDIPTVKEESVDDAVAAVDLLTADARIDRERIYVVGHSLGASLAPRIAGAAERAHGIVLLAGSTRSQGTIKLDQTSYLAPIWTESSEKRAQLLEKARQVAARLDAPDLGPDEIVDGIPGRYWIDLRDNHGLKTIGELEVPILVLQGERDYQVTMEDFRGWQRALEGRGNATLRSYPALNHHFMPGEGPSTPWEYQVPNHVPEQVIDDLAAWLKQS